METGDDAAVYRLGEDTALVFTVDYFPPIVDDAYSYGAIAAANSLSDVYAMGGRPLLALNLMSFPMGLPREIMVDILRGGYEKAREAGCLLVGGHTVDDAEPKYGLAVIGTVEPGKQVTNAGARPGDALVLTKPIGTGIITTAGKQDAASPIVLQEAITTMSTLNRDACEAMMKVGVNACTDITGFGLLGHLAGMARASGVTARVFLSRVPVLPGTWDLVARGIAPGGTRRNMESMAKVVQWDPSISGDAQTVLCDAQTSGGLLIAVPQPRLQALLLELQSRHVTGAVIGELIPSGGPLIHVLP